MTSTDTATSTTASSVGGSSNNYPKDGTSLSNPNEIEVTHMDWTIDVDFDKKTLHGNVRYTLKYNDTTTDDNKVLQLDTNNLIIHRVISDQDCDCDYELISSKKEKEHLGSQLCITLPTDTKQIIIIYETTVQSSAIQFLDASQTSGKKYPYLFTQCQAIHARSLLPCQDRPGVKATWTAQVTVPQWATCVMSAVQIEKKEDKIEKEYDNDDNTTPTKTYYWEQRIPVSSYLIAMAVGQLECRTISDRCRVWSEPAVVDAAASDFDQTEEFLKIAEELSGIPYAWGRYDLLCLVPSFPYGGMENPCLTFVTPTLLTGDKSLADVIAHEIAHSWTGNLVTNATWDHFWLNEGWTMWFQRKIMARIHNSDKFFDFDAMGGYKSLQDTLTSEVLPEKFKSLVLDIQDNDPDDAYSSIAYEKGFALLYTLEQKVGATEFQNFFRTYLQKYQSETVTSEKFREFFTTQFPSVQFDWDTWLYKPGMPPTKPKFDTTMAEESQNLAEAWYRYDQTQTNNSGEITTNDNFESITDWSSNRIICFLDTLLVLTTTNSLELSTLTKMKELYNLDQTRNSEILFRFCQLCLASEDVSILPVALRFVTSQGRMKYTRPLYRALYKSHPQLAVDTFLKHSDTYHPICSKMVASDLSVPLSSNEEQEKKLDHGEKKKDDNKSAATTSSSTTTLLTAAAAVVSIAIIGVLVRRKK